MYIETDETALRCDIWVDNQHSHSYKESAAYQEAVKSSQKAGYAVCVYVGGNLPLLPVIDDLLHAPDFAAA